MWLNITKTILFLIIVSSAHLSAQSFYQISYRDSMISMGNQFTKNGNGGYCILGQTISSSSQATRDLIIHYIDSEGSHIWSNKYGTISNEYPADIIKTPENDFVVCASTTGGPFGAQDILLFKIDSTGSILWSRTFGGSQDENGSAILISPDGGIFIAGNTKSFGSVTKSALLMKTDADGNLIWSRINDSQSNNSYYTICYNDSGQIVVGGNCYTGNFSSLYSTIFDTTGNLINYRISAISTNDRSLAYTNSILAANGDIIFCGSATNASNNYEDILVSRQDNNGNILWQKIYPGLGYATSIAEDSLNNLQISTYNLNTLAYTSVPYILTLDANGNYINASTYFDPYARRSLNDIMITEDGMLASVGSSLDGNDGETMFLKTNLNLNSGCQQQLVTVNGTDITTLQSTAFNQQVIVLNSLPFIIDRIQPTNIQSTTFCYSNNVSDHLSSQKFSINPNPTSGIFKVTLSDYDVHHISVFNSLGQKVIQKVIGQEFADIDLSKNLSGIYFFRIDNSHNGKIILTGN